jgi:hypothetical protein
LGKDITILDVGAGEGETIAFWFLHGYSKFVAVEIDRQQTRRLQRSVRTNNRLKITFSDTYVQFLDAVQFAKIDCEGCESEMLTDAKKVQYSFAMERHSRFLEERFRSLYGKRIMDEARDKRNETALFRVRSQ